MNNQENIVLLTKLVDFLVSNSNSSYNNFSDINIKSITLTEIPIFVEL